MTLVPIIYTSLIIFSSLLFFVMLVSYLSFKARSRSRKNITLERIAMNNGMMPKPIIVGSSNPNRFISKMQSFNDIKPKLSNRPITDGRKVSKEKSISTQITNRKELLREKEENNFRRHNDKGSLRATRLEIMNDSNKFRNTSEYDNEHAYHHEKMIEANLLSYYDDRSETDFVFMNASALRQAQ